MNYIKAAEVSSNNALLDDAIRQGLSLMRNPDISEAQFKIWVEYSKNLLGLISNNPNIYDKLFKCLYSGI